MKESKSAPVLIMTATVRRTIQRLETGDLVGADDRVGSLEGVADVVRRASRFDPQLIPVLATLLSETLCVLRRGQGLEEGCVGRSEGVVRRVVRVPERVASRLGYRVLRRQRWAPHQSQAQAENSLRTLTICRIENSAGLFSNATSVCHPLDVKPASPKLI
jgi:hypothetical protein